jgi:hypothetical protein
MRKIAIAQLLLTLLIAGQLSFGSSVVIAPGAANVTRARPELSLAPEPTSEPEPTVVYGIATWYDADRNGGSSWYTRDGIKLYAAAGPALRKLIKTKWKMKPKEILIESRRTGLSVIAYVVDWCACHGGGKNERLVDLSPAVWDALGVDLKYGVMEVRITLP